MLALVVAVALTTSAVPNGDDPAPLPVLAGGARAAETPVGTVVDGYRMSHLPAEEVVATLASHGDSVAVLHSLGSAGTGPESLFWLSHEGLDAFEAAHVDAALLPEEDQYAALRDGLGAILAEEGLLLTRVQTWIGMRAAGPEAGDMVLLVMATLATGETRLVVGRHDRILGELVTSSEFEGRFVEERRARRAGDTPPEEFLSNLFKKKKNKPNPDKWAKFKKCFVQCIKSNIGFAGLVKLVCLTAKAILCIGSGPAYGACLALGAASCGIGALATQIVACGLVALAC